ncbi:macrophage migration inhibitory factor family protein [Chthoniobacter flavus Ellin428]|uniref:L-dopachrome isomerase n=1 Tax=Chthoniobacter flavus Ellin428 TaxID=497964 RepID=B4CXD9_9BACT|nr:phenylpyruvate tautomerase MIF-related protein [Chthoniobacter flavus]EDY20937.1 macrophage migration inhibitory factor family protein [Chthoniobacter flavus Ellin428]TCO88667.1 macrophage migration inhibitory factor (MIF) [Chthoniobacter flavus]
MPYLTVSTNAEISPGAEKQFLKEASLAVAVGTGKPEQYVMVKFEAAQSMLFAGSDEPAAFVELKSIGFPAGGVEKIAASLCTLVANHLHVPSGRIFTVFHDVKAPMWGQGGGMFG